MSRPMYAYPTEESSKIIHSDLIPKILKLIEESGISFTDTSFLMTQLKHEIEQHTRAFQYQSKFTLDERSMN